MAPMADYWLDLFTGQTWQEFLAAGGEVTGFRESRWPTVQRSGGVSGASRAAASSNSARATFVLLGTVPMYGTVE